MKSALPAVEAKIRIPCVYKNVARSLDQRLETHNSGDFIHTAKYRPWKLIMYSAFDDLQIAKEFEKYLKSQSGRAFARKRFWVMFKP